ncbi:MAG: glutamate--tRNA ligase [Alphaproteobacteria bacterium]|nr:MAG: glutamate--tRNA ligase [Alphaproteobacteria bacterium]
MIRTRFAPSPTGKLHIGGARTALFNYLFAKSNGGKFFLRIEDTDIKRSSKENIDVILNGLNWLKLIPSEKEKYQSNETNKHIDIAYKLLKNGFAYRCYLSSEELIEMRNESRKKGEVIKSPYRDNLANIKNKDFVIRLKMPLEGQITIYDKVQGKVNINNSILDDMILLRKDNSPTYMLASVVDDYNMEITNIIRGDDHFNNAFRQIQIIKYMNWPIPTYAHIPLIHGEDGTKLSKRHGAENVMDYKQDGYEVEVLKNYLLRLGYSINDDKIYDLESDIFNFKLDKINKSPSRFDLKKLSNMNALYLRTQPLNNLLNRIKTKFNLNEEILHRLDFLLPDLIQRYTYLNEIEDDILWLSNDFTNNWSELDQEDLNLVLDVINILKSIKWNLIELKENIEKFLVGNNLKMKDLGPLLRSILTGKTNTPDIFKVIFIIGRNECIKRLTKVL